MSTKTISFSLFRNEIEKLQAQSDLTMDQHVERAIEQHIKAPRNPARSFGVGNPMSCTATIPQRLWDRLLCSAVGGRPLDAALRGYLAGLPEPKKFLTRAPTP